MAFPNLIALLLLSGKVVRETKAYLSHVKERNRRVRVLKANRIRMLRESERAGQA